MPPAARLADLTAHGGAIGPAVTGLPAKVMIGFMPAACMGDPHLCPAFDGPKPHVGGTILKGSLTVQIGNKPAARVGDPTECKGPPGTIAKGEPTVKIGDMGMGGAGGAGGGSAEDAGTGSVPGAEAADVAAQIGALKAASAEGMAFCQQCTKQPAPPRVTKPPAQPLQKTPGSAGSSTTTPEPKAPGSAGSSTAVAEPPSEKTTEPTPIRTDFIAIELVDENGKPIPKEPYEVMLPSGEIRRGKLNAQGTAKVEGIESGMCQVTFPELRESRLKQS